MAYNTHNIVAGLLCTQRALTQQSLHFQRELEKQRLKSEELQAELESHIARCVCRDSNNVDDTDDESDGDGGPPPMRQLPVNAPSSALPIFYENYEDLTDWEEGGDILRFIGATEVRFVIFSTKKLA